MRKPTILWMNKAIITLVLAISNLSIASLPDTTPLSSLPSLNDKKLISSKQSSNLPGSTYEWWYGCAPTVAGMVMGYYDRYGYDGNLYENLVPGGVAEISTFGSSPALADSIIASPGHISDFYSGGLNASGDDVSPPFHDFDSLADFMGTSQDSAENANSDTTFWWYDDNSRLYESELYDYGPSYYNSSGMYGIGEYLEYAGYDADVLYNQRIFGYDEIQAGFTFDQYKAEIDAGRPVLIHITTHNLLGYGYIEGTDTINVYDTWGSDGQNPGTMTWGGSYPSDHGNLDHFGITVLVPIPEPATLLLFCSGMLLSRKRR